MIFNSLAYFLFLPIVFLVHHFSQDRFRWLVLLLASFVFYGALNAPHLIIVLLLVTATSYICGIWLNHINSERAKLFILWGGIALNVSTLIFLRCLPFVTCKLNCLLKLIAPNTTVLAGKAVIAVGVSYFVFQGISYLIDVYLGIEKPEQHIGYFALYMSFFPKLMQGPIERAGDLLPQLKAPKSFNYESIRSGMLLFAWGMLKKIVIADRLGLMVNSIYGDVYAYKGIPLLLAIYYYSLQIYFDFSGYTDMALGTARMFNINLTQNFNNPYLATTVSDFWRRWHISFSRWILDYIFKPLQLSLRNWHNCGVAIAIFVTFLVSGVWHGASVGFIVWGGLHGLYMACAIFYKPLQKKLRNVSGIDSKSRCYVLWQRFIVFNLVSLAWVFFRNDDVGKAIYIIKSAVTDSLHAVCTSSLSDLISGKFNISLNQGLYEYAILLVFLVPCLIVGNIDTEKIAKHKLVYRWSIYCTISLSIIIFGVYTKTPAFIYMKF